MPLTVRPASLRAARLARLLTCLVSVLAVPGGVLAGRIEPMPGEPAAPALELPDLAGHTHRLSDYGGELVLVNFWASWCPPCLEEMPSLQRLSEAFSGRPLRVLLVNSGEGQLRAAEAARRVGVAGPVLLDPEQRAFNAWGVKVLPTSFLVGPDGRIRHRVLGPVEWDDIQIHRLVERLLEERQETPSTPPSTLVAPR